MSKPNSVQKTALAITRAVGSPLSIAAHSLLFIACFIAAWEGYIAFDRMLLILTTIVSLEAIYLSIFIQMTINYTTQSIEEVAEDIEEIQEDVGEIQEDVDELQEDVEDISEDVEEMSEEDKAEEQFEAAQQKTLSDIQTDLRKLMQDIDRLQNK
ncbi:MAG: hypothetical protein WC050_02225 [Candidatus Paceibacterota bacterium]